MRFAFLFLIACTAGVNGSSTSTPDAPRGDGGTGNEGIDPALAAKLQAALEKARIDQSALGVAAAIVVPGQGVWSGASGLVRPNGAAVTTADRYPIGSITKTFTGVVVMKLVQDGKLALNDAVSKWFPNFPGAAQIRVQHLLEHTSGIRDYLENPNANLAQPIAHERLLDYPAQQGLAFTPGSQWSYSNTNYIMLGLIAERVAGTSYAQLVRTTIIAPLGLAETYLDGEETGPAFSKGFELQNGQYVATPVEHPSWAWSAGAIVSSLPDQLRFFRGLLGGELLNAATLARMKMGVQIPNAPAGVVYGLGIETSTTAYGPFHTHGGLIHYVKSASAGLPNKQIEVAVYANTVGAEEYAILFAIVDALAP